MSAFPLRLEQTHKALGPSAALASACSYSSAAEIPHLLPDRAAQRGRQLARRARRDNVCCNPRQLLLSGAGLCGHEPSAELQTPWEEGRDWEDQVRTHSL